MIDYIGFLIEQYEIKKMGFDVDFKGREVYHLLAIQSEMNTYAREIYERKKELKKEEK